MHISSQDRRSINDTIENWDHSTYNNPILNLIWQLLPGFILWQIWKERNKRIFHSQPSKPKTTWETIKSLIKETIRRKYWTEEDLQCNPEEQCTLENWQPIFNKQLGAKLLQNPLTSPTSWTPPLEHFIKVNFDGASKGNSGTSTIWGRAQKLQR
jgi:hypothetical protein